MTPDDRSVIDFLNGLLKNRLTAINQYFLHARMLKHRGEIALADHEYKISIEAMRHADELVELVLTRGGVPNLQDLDRLAIGNAAQEMLINDLILVEAAHRRINGMIPAREAAGDDDLSELLGRIRASLREHGDFIHTHARRDMAA